MQPAMKTGRRESGNARADQYQLAPASNPCGQPLGSSPHSEPMSSQSTMAAIQLAGMANANQHANCSQYMIAMPAW